VTIDELIEDLRNLSAAGHGECEVKLAMQPSWPFEYTFDLNLFDVHSDEREELNTQLAEDDELTDEDRAAINHRLNEIEETGMTLYLREVSQIGYASKDIW